jgi:uncharacterized secreted protein with C-terminal beta-propeller domain
MQKRLSSLVGKDILVSIYTDVDEPDSFKLGYLLQMDNNNILMNMVDAYGEENGFCTIKMSDIFIFDGDKMYSEKMQKLFVIKNQTRKYIANLNTNPISDFLKYAVDNNLLIEVNEDDNYMGHVSYFSEETLVLEIIDNYCNDMGTATIDMEYVKTLKCQNRYLKDLELLYSRK